MEIFKDVVGFPDYEVSNYGRVRTKSRMLRYVHAVTNQEHFRTSAERFLKVQYNDRTGYKFHQLYKDKKMYNKTIHRLVADAFLGEHPELIVNHKDGNKHNNIVENLEWCSNSYNHKHATDTGLKAKGSDVATSKLNNQTVHAIKYFLTKGYTQSELSRAFLISRPTITLISLGKTWKHVALTASELTVKEEVNG